MAHGSESKNIVILHLVGGVMSVAAYSGYGTAWWFVLQLQCRISQASFSGCADSSACPCVVTGSCSAGDLASSGCAQCLAPRAEVCNAVHASYNMYLLAFNGLLFLVTSLPAFFIDAKVLFMRSFEKNATQARLEAIRIGVEQQIRLISSGDKPTVTPGTLSDWVSTLIKDKSKKSIQAAEKCRAVLRDRGYELVVQGTRSKGAAPQFEDFDVERKETGHLLRAFTKNSYSNGSEHGVNANGGVTAVLNDDIESGVKLPRTNRNRQRTRSNRVTPEETDSIMADRSDVSNV
jgi:hypothetical protein